MGKFGGGEVWRIDSFRAFGERKLGELIDQPIDYLTVSTNLVWQIMDDLENSTNFPPPNFPAIQYFEINYQ